MHIKHFALAGGIVLGGLIFVLTLLGVSGVSMSLLTTVFIGTFIGYTVTVGGSIIGLIYGFITGYIICYALAYVYNMLESK